MEEVAHPPTQWEVATHLRKTRVAGIAGKRPDFEDPDLVPDSPFPEGVHERSLLIDDAARALGVSRRTVYYRIREGRLVTIRAKCGSQRVLVSSIEALKLASGRRAGDAGEESSVAD